MGWITRDKYMAQVSYYSEDKKQGLEGHILALRGISGREGIRG